VSTLLARTLRLGGAPLPIPQWQVFDRGEFIARVDLAWPWLKLAVEYDGQWHADRNQLARDRVRIRNLNAAGWYVYPVTRNDMWDLDQTVQAIKIVIAERSRIL
jgi:very-short-patch-repair endonuclease